MNHILPNNKISTLKEFALQRIGEVYDAREARNVVNELFRHYLNFSAADLVVKANDTVSESQMLLIYKAAKRIAQHEPLQYVLGSAYFFGMDLHVNSSVLIPRPETEELVRWILDEIKPNNHSVLDLGTGSGAIALALKKAQPNWNVCGVDVSKEALQVAQRNSTELQLEVAWKEVDILVGNLPEANWTCIVSNPPYITVSEGNEMRTSVVQHEPHLALFVPENDPLIFYRRILELANKCETVKQVFFEIHENYSSETLTLGASMGWKGELKNDLQGKPRMLLFTK
ncbi:MAG: peptide chain release factor N(5)-glutamine methyltransferase [Flavobacteriales bacterium]|jgi:release factor glutamine methyltransferase|nr:peptide chain release factor N(5)-glutamine methyltransferase [Flavobacteriales bacterium]MDP4716104.1 peptide chain release factor N(5)-glutamine methyltransferase [Flavobacteriales bacterium]MDP4732241.1 peptide chain release factor N(5)-glutamine methyltransferase [Flavobacteriales bacterium]MDP4818000.1 peptide chain release factor N(5)-glutamine methyltransferase [Flavobacteriales bacterium]